MNILIIDDERAICSSLSFALDDEYRVFTASGPEESLQLLEQEPIDGILLDLNLRGTSGIELCARSRKSSRTQSSS